MKKFTFLFSITKVMLLVLGLIVSTAQADISINCGGSATGSFVADQYFSGGATYTNTSTIDMSQIPVNPPPAAIFNTERYDASTYTIPNLTVGSAQTVTLYFVETYVTTAGGRLFNVFVNGTQVLTNFDIYATAGGTAKAIARTFYTTANANGQVVIALTNGPVQSPKICGITVAENIGGPTLSLSTTSLNLAAAAGSSGSFDVNSNSNWTVSSNQAWLTVNPASGSNLGTVAVTATENTTPAPRSAIVTVMLGNGASQSLTVTQTPVLTLSPNWILVAAAANSSRTFNVVTDIGWTASSDQSWLSISTSSGSGNGSVTVTAAENTDPSLRTAIVTVVAGGSSQAVTVIQSAGAGACVVPPMPPFSALVDNPLLPDPFTFMDGRKVTSMDDWKCRRKEIAALAQEFEFGYMQDTNYGATTGAMSGSSLVVTVKDNNKTITFNCSITYPSTGTGPYPALIGVGGSSLPSPASQGIAVITFPNETVASQASASSRGTGVFYTMYGSNHSAGAMMAWAWGVNRMIDALEKTPAANIDPSRLAVTGCSRNGKGALTVGAFCDRIKLTIPQESGAGGCSSWRVAEHQRFVEGSDVQWLAQIVTENCWFRASFAQFGNAVNKLPIDQHEVAALVAPRALLFIENGSQDWLGNQSTWTVGNASHMVWEAMGIPEKMGYSSDGTHSHCAFPAAQTPTVNSYYQKFLFGADVNTNVMYTDGIGRPYVPANWVEWIDWTAPSIPDNVGPTPDPMTWVAAPSALSTTSVAMLATSVFDATIPQYFFECTTDPGLNSGWQGSPVYLLTGLDRNTTYSFRVKAKDSDVVPHETNWSGTISATTPNAAVSVSGSWVSGTIHAKEPGISRGLLFFAHAERTAISPFTCSSVTYGGQPMTKIADMNFGTTGSVVSASAFWLGEAGIVAATDGNFVVAWSSGTNSGTGYGSVFLEGVNHTNPIGPIAVNGTATGATITTSPLSTIAGDMVIAAGTQSNTGTYTANNGFVKAEELTITSADAVHEFKGFKQSAGGMETPSTTHSTTNGRQVLLGLVIKVEYPPTVNAGDNIQILSKDQTLTTLQGTAADEADPLEYCWLEGSQVLLDWSPVGVNGVSLLNLGTVPDFPVGNHTLALKVREAVLGGLTTTDRMVLTIDNSPPQAQPAPSHQVVQIGVDPIVVVADVTDFDGDVVTYQWLLGSAVLASGSVQTVHGGAQVAIPDLQIAAGDSRFPLGTHQIELKVSDGINAPVSSFVTVEVIDTVAPSLSPVPSTTILWPPNHKLVPVTIAANAFDNDGGDLIHLAVTVQSSEPAGTEPDYYIDSVNDHTGIIALQLRSERAGKGDGRTYTITITATDVSGNSSVAVVVISAPHDQRKK